MSHHVFCLAEGVYVDTDGHLVRHATMQWGESPYAIGKIVGCPSFFFFGISVHTFMHTRCMH